MARYRAAKLSLPGRTRAWAASQPHKQYSFTTDKKPLERLPLCRALKRLSFELWCSPRISARARKRCTAAFAYLPQRLAYERMRSDIHCSPLACDRALWKIERLLPGHCLGEVLGQRCAWALVHASRGHDVGRPPSCPETISSAASGMDCRESHLENGVCRSADATFKFSLWSVRWLQLLLEIKHVMQLIRFWCSDACGCCDRITRNRAAADDGDDDSSAKSSSARPRDLQHNDRIVNGVGLVVFAKAKHVAKPGTG